MAGKYFPCEWMAAELDQTIDALSEKDLLKILAYSKDSGASQ
jgi:hypothetical protein